MAEVERVQAYYCPGGHLERDKRRALAWHLADLVNKKTGHESLSFSGALVLLEEKERAVDLLKQDGDDRS